MPSIDSLLQRDSTGQIPTKEEQQELERMERLKQSVAAYALKPLTSIGSTSTPAKPEQRIPATAATTAKPAAADHQHHFVCRHCNATAPTQSFSAHLGKHPRPPPTHSLRSQRPAADELSTQQPAAINSNEQAFIKQVQHHLEQWQRELLVIEVLPEQIARLETLAPYVDRCVSAHPTEAHLQLIHSGVKGDGFCLVKRRTKRLPLQDPTVNTKLAASNPTDEIDSMFADVDADKKSRKKKHKKHDHKHKDKHQTTDDR